MFGTRVNDFCPRYLVIIEQGIQRLLEVLGAYKNRWLFVTKETSRTKSPTDAWEGGRETASSFLHP